MKTVNKAALELFGYEQNEMIGFNVGKLFESDVYTSWLDSIKDKKTLSKNDAFTFHKKETYIIAKNKKKIPVLISGSALINQNNSIQGAVLVAVDISDRKKAELKISKMNEELEERVKERTHQLEVANKDLEAFSYSVSHDLRAPLRAVTGFTKKLNKNYNDKLDDEGKRLINVIFENADRMDHLIQDLLAFSRLGRKAVVNGSVDMNKMFIDVANELQNASPERMINFKISKLPSISADATLIQQVVINLLSNAVKFTQMKEEATIEVGNLEKKKQLVYYVKDNGAGFDMKYADRLFNVFERLHSPSDFEGTGVGLAIVHRIIQRHGGEVWAEAKENEGAVFYFSLPNPN
jgi:PAS domain S-box-containing protein